MTAVATVLVASGVFFLVVGAIGLIRFPDVYTRMHAAGKCDTLGLLLVLLGIACGQGVGLVAVKLLVVAAFVFITSPTATHAIARAGYRHRRQAGAAQDPS